MLDLLALADRDLRNAKVSGLDNDWRFNIAYNAALQAGTAALVASGFAVPKGDSHHFRVIGSLALTVGLEGKLVDQLDRYRRKRSVSVYDVAGAISDAESRGMLALAEDLVEHVHAWLLQNHPDLMDSKS
ncbi:hypothetical protein [Humisphaera borealis]|uniref:HEPN domain-containing protein n=1 Tax=Humisphaera borealis TaxID=2807512 RepID=A0A7M2WY41_9BACT|nr:hypothetical protein [Humisphaera borealis]QOV89731.1 hypothetical protein IPV69_26700 [Humisphaera borealis]